MLYTDKIKVGTLKVLTSHHYLPKTAIPSDVAKAFKSFIGNKNKIEFCHVNVGVSFILQEDIILRDESKTFCDKNLEYKIEKGTTICLVCAGNAENLSKWNVG